MKFNIVEFKSPTDFSNIELTPMQAIRAYCKECCGYSMYEAKRCEIKTCPLNKFITRKRTYNISDEERERRRNLLKKNYD